LFTVAGAGIVIAVALFANHAVNTLSPGEIVPWNNPTVTVSVGQRMLTALWVQVLYVCKTIAPITLSTDYSFNEITNVMGFADWRSWAGLALIAGAVPLSVRYHQFRAPILAYAILFSPTANLLFPLTDIMQEHLAYAPSMGLALLAAILVARCRHWKIIILAAALIFGARTLVRNRDWLNDEHFCAKAAETSPNSANANFLNGYSRWATRDYAGAIVAFDRTIAINPTYTKAYFGRGIAFAALGRGAEAVADFRVVQRLDGYKHALPDDVRTYVERYSQLRGISAN
jgi:tetratricopeptide (TPR) repeat protein